MEWDCLIAAGETGACVFDGGVFPVDTIAETAATGGFIRSGFEVPLGTGFAEELRYCRGDGNQHDCNI